jgi:hypothetical protein
MKKTSQWRAERNRKALAPLRKALPGIFPPPVLTHALNRPFIPPMPRRAVDAYCGPACEGARAQERHAGGLDMAARHGTQARSSGKFPVPPAPFREGAFARGAGYCCVCGQPVYRLGWHVDLWDEGMNQNATWHAACVAA